MTELSPAAKAVDDAFWTIVIGKYDVCSQRRACAAALRAAIAHLPNSAMYPSSDWGCGWRTGINDARQVLLAIAAELEA